MSFIDTKDKTLFQVISEQYPYIKDFAVRDDPGSLMITITYSHDGDIDESFAKLMRYIAPDAAYRLINTKEKSNAKS